MFQNTWNVYHYLDDVYGIFEIPDVMRHYHVKFLVFLCEYFVIVNYNNVSKLGEDGILKVIAT